MNRRIFTALCCWSVTGLTRYVAAEPPEQAGDGGSLGKPNAVLPTMGGRQFWGDELFFHGWHVRRNTLTGHCRLLDKKNHRHAWARSTSAGPNWPMSAAAKNCRR